MADARSPNYPSLGLDEAIDLAARLYKAEKRSTVSTDMAVRAWGYKTLNGTSRSLIGALRKYGLLDNVRDGIRLSDLAMTILFPESDAEKRVALRAAVTHPALFRELAEHDGASDANLVGRLVRQGFTEPGAKAAIASFRASMSLVIAEDPEYDATEESDPELMKPGRSAPTAMPLQIAAASNPSAGSQVFVVPLGGGAIAQLSVRGGELTRRGVEMLERYLSLAKEAMTESGAALVPDAAESDKDG
jgi:hypothetical protein